MSNMSSAAVADRMKRFMIKPDPESIADSGSTGSTRLAIALGKLALRPKTYATLHAYAKSAWKTGNRNMCNVRTDEGEVRKNLWTQLTVKEGGQPSSLSITQEFMDFVLDAILVTDEANDGYNIIVTAFGARIQAAWNKNFLTKAKGDTAQQEQIVKLAHGMAFFSGIIPANEVALWIGEISNNKVLSKKDATALVTEARNLLQANFASSIANVQDEHDE